MSDNAVGATGVLGTGLALSLQGTLSIIAALCTIIVVGPKAIEQLESWKIKYWPKLQSLAVGIWKRITWRKV